ncbi:gamma-glutamylcyclotransferase [bacterium]|nr:gamma-glutamylcyclotransferase [bacterium]
MTQDQWNSGGGYTNGAEGGMAQPNPPAPEAVLEQLSAEVNDAAFFPVDTRGVYYFAYDVYMDQGHISRYVKGLIPIKPVYMPHHRLSFPHYHPPEETGLPSLQRTNDPADRVWGLLYDAKPTLGDEGIRDFKPFERHLRVPGRYHRSSVHVLDRAERRYSAFTYVLSLDDGKQSPPSENYLQRWVESARERRLPDEWVAYLEMLRRGSGSGSGS